MQSRSQHMAVASSGTITHHERATRGLTLIRQHTEVALSLLCLLHLGTCLVLCLLGLRVHYDVRCWTLTREAILKLERCPSYFSTNPLA